MTDEPEEPRELPRWGRAGVRLSEQEARARAAMRRKRALLSADRMREREAMAKRRWAAGLVVPASITSALDMHQLEGPEVDQACGVEEPAVDLWEEGKLYPTWEQLVALSKLTGVTPYFLTIQREVLNIYDTSMRFHVNLQGYTPTAPILRYPDDVVRRCPGTNLDDPMRAGID